MLAGMTTLSAMLAAQDARPTFRASVERVTLSATVRTGRGRPVTNLKSADFQLFDSGEPRSILEVRRDPTPVSIALLVDFSGSMDVAARRQASREHVHQLLELLQPGVDSAGLWLTDRGSTNGSVVSAPGLPPRVAEPGARVRVPVGSTIHLGDRRVLVHPQAQA